MNAAGMPQPQAEAVAEELGNPPTRAEMREEIRREIELALAKHFRQMVMLMLAMHAFSVSLMATLFLFLQG